MTKRKAGRAGDGTLTYREQCQEAADFILAHAGVRPAIGLVLGSGLGATADILDGPVSIPYADVPFFPVPTVPGHAGAVVVGAVGGATVVAFRGRFHDYEGHAPRETTRPVRVLGLLGVRTLVLTAAVGALEPAFAPGAIVAVSDHLNLFGPNPLRGPDAEAFGPRFPDMTEVYALWLRAAARATAAKLGQDLPEGVYAYMPGPSYETPAEVRALRMLGADLVGMSTVPEAIAARQGGMDVLALAVVSNWAAGLAASPLSHAEVLEAGRAAGPRLTALLAALIPKLGAAAGGAQASPTP